MSTEGRAYKPVLEMDKCTSCSFCRFLCPDLAITEKGDKKGIEIDYFYCKGCGICAAVCPNKAIKMVSQL